MFMETKQRTEVWEAAVFPYFVGSRKYEYFSGIRWKKSSARNSQFVCLRLCPNMLYGRLKGRQQRGDGSGPKVS